MKQELGYKKRNTRFYSGKIQYIFIFAILLFFLFAYFQVTSIKRLSNINRIIIPQVLKTDHIRGNTDAAITLIEYSDFECPDCQYFQPTVKQILATYGKNIRWIVRPYPLPQHANAEKEAEAAECAAALGGNSVYWKFSDMLFSQEVVTTNGTGFSLTKLPDLAQKVGVNRTEFTNCLQNGKFYQTVQSSIQSATKAGITQLPSVVIVNKESNVQIIIGNQAFNVFKNIIDQVERTS